MSVQYRPELGSISLMPCYSPSSSSDSLVFNAHHHSVDSQQASTAAGLAGLAAAGFGGLVKFRSQGSSPISPISPLSPLSPQDFSLVSDAAVYPGGGGVYNSPTCTVTSTSTNSSGNSGGGGGMSSATRRDTTTATTTGYLHQMHADAGAGAGGLGMAHYHHHGHHHHLHNGDMSMSSVTGGDAFHASIASSHPHQQQQAQHHHHLPYGAAAAIQRDAYANGGGNMMMHAQQPLQHQQQQQQHLLDTSCSIMDVAQPRTHNVAQMLQQLESALLDDDDSMCGAAAAGGGGGQEHHQGGGLLDPNLAFDIDQILYRSSPSPSDDTITNVDACASGASEECSSGGGGGLVVVHQQQQVQQQQEHYEQEQEQQHAMEELVPNKAFFGRNKLEELLVQCAEAVSNQDLGAAQELMAQLNQSVSIYGDPTQRLAAYMVEGLVARVASSGRRFHKVLKCKQPPNVELLSAMQILYEVCPYFKFGYMAANGAIAEAFKDETRVHIIDFEITAGAQWVTLIQALAARPGGPPHLRLTGVDDPQAQSSTGSLHDLGRKLTRLAKSVGVPFQFHAVPKKVTEVQPWELERRDGEALACNFALELHHVPDESVCTSNPRDRLLRMVKSLRPKVVTMVEQELNTNTAPFFPRFLEVLSYYAAIFESLDVTLARESKDRVNVEQQCLARDIVNIIACEGTERVERHEVIWKWRARMSMAGFKPYPLSSYVNTTIKTLLQSYCDKYRLKEEGGALYLGWQNRALITASAWH